MAANCTQVNIASAYPPCNSSTSETAYNRGNDPASVRQGETGWIRACLALCLLEHLVMSSVRLWSLESYCGQLRPSM